MRVDASNHYVRVAGEPKQKFQSWKIASTGVRFRDADLLVDRPENSTSENGEHGIGLYAKVAM
ncbi:MAG TPA: hypothetical protein VK633_02450 [Verrucomicrobiae bacterium]|nr:hypothetical protein [Verrucomicrobiae bacterium]